MGVVELNRYLLRQLVPVVVSRAEPPHQVAQGTGNQEICLNKPQTLAEAGRIVRIKDPRERFRCQSFGDGAYEITVAKHSKIEEFGSGGGPQTKSIDGLPAKAHYGSI